MLGFFRRSRSGPAPDVSCDLEAAAKAMDKITADYGDFIERNPMPLGLVLADEEELPYPKKAILSAVCLALQVESDPEVRGALIVCAMSLANFQPGVGKGRLHQLGIEMTQNDIDTLSAEILMAKIISNPEGKARFDKFMPAVKAEISHLRVRLTEIDEAFHARQRFALPVTTDPFEDSATFDEATAAHGRGDHATALRLIRPLADQGNARAQFNVGVMYDKGHGVPHNYEEAAKWYHLAADQGVAAAQCNLGIMYDKGQGVPQNDAEAAKWFQSAADQGHALAQFNLGGLYDNGRGVQQNYAEAMKWSRKAADQRHVRAQHNLGVMYVNGQGAPQDFVRAHMWFSLAAAQGQQESLENRDAIARHMTPAQIADAQMLARGWKATKHSP